MGSQPVEFDEFAACLRALRERAGLSYGALARRTLISSSSLHRYCSGSYVPQDYGAAHRFATACGASPEELRRLHRLWALADAARDADSGTGSGAGTRTETDTVADTNTDTGPYPGRGPRVDQDGRSGSDQDQDPGQDVGGGGGGEPEPDGGQDQGRDQNQGRDQDQGQGRNQDQDQDQGRDRDRAPGSAPAPDTGADPDTAPAPHPSWHRRTSPVLAVIALVLALGATAWGIAAVSGTGSVAGGGSGGDEERLLFSAACAEPVSLGQRSACVREVQRLLARSGAELDVDGDFGPQTLRRVTAFQVLSGIAADGVVGEETKKALYAPDAGMDTWAPGRVRQRIREVFRETPQRAIAVAGCQSLFDPLHIVPNADGTRRWGVFQLSDAGLRELGGTPGDAMDPEWNIQAAHRLWSRAKGFGDWAHCERAAAPDAVGPALVEAVGGRPTPPERNASTSPAPSSAASSSPAPSAPGSSPPAPATTTCPTPGQRFKTLTDDRVYLVGPGRSLYYVPDAVVYFNLWDDWHGVTIVSGSVFADCAWDEARELAKAFLARTGTGSKTYIWDAWHGFRGIADGAAFDRYGFSEAKIQTRSSLSPISGDTGWR